MDEINEQNEQTQGDEAEGSAGMDDAGQGGMAELYPARFVWLGLAVLASWGIGVYANSALPEQIPMHWNIHGEVDRWGTRFEGAFIFPIIFTAIAVLLYFAPRIDPRAHSYKQFGETYTRILSGISLMMLYMQVGILLLQLGYDFNIQFVVMPGIGALFIYLGNMLPKLRANWVAGVRTPWTLENEEVWIATNRLIGRWMVGLGVLFIMFSWTPPVVAFIVMMAGSLIMAAVAVGYSYHVYNKLEKGKG